VDELTELRDRPLVFVDDLARPVLSDDDQHHFERVLRVGPGDPVTLGDGAGRWRPARFARRPEPTGAIASVAPPPWAVTIAFSPVKGQRAEWFVQKLTELGVDRLLPIVSERTVVRWDEARAAKAHAKMVTVAREACLQARRLVLPIVDPPTTLGDVLGREPAAVLADPGGRPIGVDDRIVIVGPEGGFTDGERHEAATVALPGHVLRAETAAVVAGALACGLRASLVAPAQ